MCTHCGCSLVESQPILTKPQQLQNHQTHILDVQKGLLSKNDRIAKQNRDQFHQIGLLTLNLLSSPGSGKTALIENTAKLWPNPHRIGAIVGDLATDNDAQRLNSVGIHALQIMTGTACHLEADGIFHALSHLNLDLFDLLVIENVGNLVCPAAYDLGEIVRVVLLSVTEGEDKPLKYPTAFHSADVVVLTKTDIADAVEFDRETAITNIHRMAPHAKVYELSARTGEGMQDWIQELKTQQNLLLNRGK